MTEGPRSNSRQPAIVLITADQLRKDALGCYGNRAVPTPHLDELASRATRFGAAYTVSPWCLPSRCSILTGLMPHNHGSYSNFRDQPLSADIPNLYTRLKGAGYSIAHVGKCHYAPVPYGETRPDRTLPYEKFREYYLSLGIDHLDLQDDKQVSVWFSDDYSQELDRAGYLEAYRDAVWRKSDHKVFTFPGPAEWHPDSWVGRKAAEYVSGYAEDEPMFVWVSFSGPHFPFDPPKEYLERVDPEAVGTGVFREGEWDDPGRIHYKSFHGKGGIEGAGTAPERACENYTDEYWTQLRRNYFANVALIDEQVGAILSALEQRFGDDALVIFTADHGEMLGDHHLWGKNNSAYEDVLNVPLLVRYPHQDAGTQTDARVMLTDILPTCLRAAGEETPELDGTDLEENVCNGGYPYIYAEGEGFVAISDGAYKYVRVKQGDREHAELFDLERDPHEFENVIERPEYATKRGELQTALLDLFMRSLLP